MRHTIHIRIPGLEEHEDDPEDAEDDPDAPAS
jgi:hypothetical protein